MTPPYLTPRLHPLPDPGPAGGVALEVRLGPGRPVRYELEAAEFTIGGAADCDVRLPGADTPARVCAVARTADALFVRRLDPAFPVLWNDRFLVPNAPERLGHGDRVAVGPLDVTVHLAGVYLHPDLATPGPDAGAGVRPPRPGPHAPPPRPEPPPTYGPDATAQLAEVALARADLQRQRDDLAAQARELESDRVLWYRRRHELETEAARPAAPGPAEGLAAREAELGRFHAELTALREQLVAQYQERRDRLAEMGAAAATVSADLDARRDRLDREAQDREPLAAELGQRQAAFDERQREQDRRAADLDERAGRLARDSAEFREQLDLAAAEHGQLARDAGRHDARAGDLDARAAALAELSAKLEVQQATLAVATAALDRQRDDLDRAAARAEADGPSADAESRRAREDELDRRTGDLAGQTATLRAKAEQLAALQERLDAERQGQLERAAALDEADAARQTFQEQLRRRADDLAARGQSLDEAGHRLTAERDGLDAARAESQRRAADLAAHAANLERQSARLREVGALVAGQKRDLAAERQAWLADCAKELAGRAEAEASQARVAAEVQALHRDAPDLHERARQALDRLASAREALRAGAAELDAREQILAAAGAEHRLAVADFRQQLLGWQARLAATRAADVVAAAPPAESPPAPPAAGRRGEVEGHLGDLREWYRRKLKDLAAARAADAGVALLPADEPDPGDRQLGERLRDLDLVDADTLTALWGEARRQRRTLRTVLLAGGAVTLYQLAMLEAGSLGPLVLGRLRVLDRLRVTPREVVYRVLDPERLTGPTRGVYTLRHLAEAEMDDAVRPDEFRQMFTAARDAAHPNLAGTVEVLELHHRPAALLEAVPGLPASDWPADAATPGAWVKLLLEAARGLDAAHRHGLTHGRISSESFVLTAAGEVKVVGVGEPMWLSTGVAAALDPTPEADLRALGQVAYGWSQVGQPGGKRRPRGKGFPEPLAAVVRRLEADPETPMADTASGAVPYRTAAELVHDLARLAAAFPCPADAHEALTRAVTESLGPARQSA